jgi:hypothetical protein
LEYLAVSGCRRAIIRVALLIAYCAPARRLEQQQVLVKSVPIASSAVSWSLSLVFHLLPLLLPALSLGMFLVLLVGRQLFQAFVFAIQPALPIGSPFFH